MRMDIARARTKWGYLHLVPRKLWSDQEVLGGFFNEVERRLSHQLTAIQDTHFLGVLGPCAFIHGHET